MSDLLKKMWSKYPFAPHTKEGKISILRSDGAKMLYEIDRLEAEVEKLTTKRDIWHRRFRNSIDECSSFKSRLILAEDVVEAAKGTHNDDCHTYIGTIIRDMKRKCDCALGDALAKWEEKEL